jgi:hypothetical protein
MLGDKFYPSSLFELRRDYPKTYGFGIKKNPGDEPGSCSRRVTVLTVAATTAVAIATASTI